MKLPVYPRGANPRVDRHIQRKPLDYCIEAVERYGAAEWVDPSDPSKGIICRNFLYFGEKRASPPSIEQIDQLKQKLKSAIPPLEPDGCRFIPPPMEKNPTLPRLNVEHVTMAANGWDWSASA